MRIGRRTFLTLAAVLALCAFAFEVSAPAQCALCKASASGLDAGGAKNLNYAVLLLLCPPVAIFCAFFFVAYKRREPPDDEGR